MQVFLETDRLVLRRLTEADVDNLYDLDSDPAVMRFLNGGTPTPRDVIQRKILPQYLRYYDRFEGYGFWAAIEKASGGSWGGSLSIQWKAAIRTTWRLATGCANRPGARGMPPKERVR
jgi:RimJ/RimL family protein N-acetyltransferase